MPPTLLYVKKLRKFAALYSGPRNLFIQNCMFSVYIIYICNSCSKIIIFKDFFFQQVCWTMNNLLKIINTLTRQNTEYQAQTERNDIKLVLIARKTDNTAAVKYENNKYTCLFCLFLSLFRANLIFFSSSWAKIFLVLRKAIKIWILWLKMLTDT